MANKSLFASIFGKDSPEANVTNHQGAIAYAYKPKHKLAQLAATGTFNDTFYASAETQLSDVLDVAQKVDPVFVAKAALYARKRGAMKDMPALLTAYLTVADPDLAVAVFNRTIDNGRMLRNFVQIMRSGAVGRKSLGSRPKRLVKQWLEDATIEQLIRASTGKDPSLADIVKMVHPKPVSLERQAFYGWLIGRPYDVEALPEQLQDFELWKRDLGRQLPDVPFQWLTSFDLTAKRWVLLAEKVGWHALRMNLNTLARHGAFGVKGATDMIANRLEDADAIKRARIMPYQLLMALNATNDAVPLKVQAALEVALEKSLTNVPVMQGNVVIAPDVSWSMQSPLTGHRVGATTAVKCIDVAALIGAAVLRKNPSATLMPFEQHVVSVDLKPFARVAVNAKRLSQIGGGGTNVSAPLALLNKREADVDLVIIVSDNESWVDDNRYGATETMRQWQKLKSRNPKAKLVCIDLQPYGTTQAKERKDILNVGGFSDAVFDTIARFASDVEKQDWVHEIEEMEI
ncbi:TROVE domain-containing protein [Parasphingorhabdus sp. DH2-15]|uniref:TROVE domain-containing protein n=1 Tax=Parasphingorhabdus sp. DH2-15 TaxID=3444112 RepID=UPI003F683097